MDVARRKEVDYFEWGKIFKLTSNSSRLRAENSRVAAFVVHESVIEDELWNLSRLSTSSVAFYQYHLVLLDQTHDLSLVLVSRQLLSKL